MPAKAFNINRKLPVRRKKVKVTQARKKDENTKRVIKKNKARLLSVFYRPAADVRATGWLFVNFFFPSPPLAISPAGVHY